MSFYNFFNLSISSDVAEFGGHLTGDRYFFGDFTVLLDQDVPDLNQLAMEITARLGGELLESWQRNILSRINGWVVRFYRVDRRGTEISLQGIEKTLQMFSPPQEVEIIPNDWNRALEEARKVGFDEGALLRLLYRMPYTADDRGRGRLFLVKAINALRTESQDDVLALMAGVEDLSYSTVRYGWVDSYSGSGIVRYPDGKKFQVTGRSSAGSPEVLSGRGSIRWKEMPSE